MGYQERYFKEITREGHVTRLSIQKRVRVADSVAAKEIGDFNGVYLSVQGQQSNIETPIVKTSLTFSMYDTSDKASTAHVKFGGWEEFYTPDQTLWRVTLKQDGATIWTGYITPDSWEDDLVYRGLIKITARDMLGHMADFEVLESDLAAYETDGLVSISDVITKAFSVAQVPMAYTLNSATPWLQYSGTKLYSWGVEVAALVGKNWYEAVEGILDSFGLTLRYSGHNTVVLAPIRNVPLCGAATAPASTYTPQFLNRSGHRELVPAYKQVIENMDYEAHEEGADTFPASAFEGSQLAKSDWDEVKLVNGAWSVRSGLGVARLYDYANEFNDVSGDASRYVFMKIYTAQNGTEPEGLRKTLLVAPCVDVTIQFVLAHYFRYYDGVMSGFNTIGAGDAVFYVEWLKADGTSLWYKKDSNVWASSMGPYYTNTSDAQTTDVTVNLTVATPNDPGYLRVYLYFKSASSYTTYTRLGDVCVSVDGNSIPKGLTVTTKYDEAQNTTLKRSPKFAQVPAWIKTAGAVQNGVYLLNSSSLYPPIQAVQWDGAGSSLPLSVFVHMQHLAMHAKANNLLTGTIRESSGAVPGFDKLWKIYDRYFVLLAGEIDYFTGYVSGAVLMEFDAYDDVWAGLSVEYTKNDAEYRRPAGSGSASASSGGGGSTPDPYVLPAATWTTLGGVKLGYFDQGAKVGVDINDNNDLFVTLTDTAIVAALGYTPAESGGGSGGTYVLPAATSSALGGIKIGFSASGKNLPVKLSSQKAYVALSDTAIIAALGYTPAQSGGGSSYVLPAASDSALGGFKTGYVENGAKLAVKLSSEKAYISLTSAAVVAALGYLPGGGFDRSAPKVSFRNFISGGKDIQVSHPESGTSGAQFVLMCYSKKNGTKHRDSNGQIYKMHRKKWCLAGGATGDGQLVITNYMDTDAIALYLIHEYLCDRTLGSRTSMRALTLRQWENRYNPSTCGFGLCELGNTTWVGHKNKMFGVALRIPNPEFDTDNWSKHNQGTPLVPRYLYTEVTPIFAVLDPETGGVGFTLREKHK